MANYLRLRFVLSADSDDRLIAELWALGTLGIEAPVAIEGADQEVLAYFEEPASPELCQRLDPASDWPGSQLVNVESIAGGDWLAEYRRRASPMELGSRFLVDPREPDEAPAVQPSDRVLLRIPARTAFGTGSHESTRLALELMEGIPMAGMRVLDVGTGSGILAFAAMALGAGDVIGLDIEAEAVIVALENCRLNHSMPGLVAGTVDCLRATSRFDLALVNVLPRRIRGDLGAIVGLLPQGGEMVVSGVLAEQHESYLRELALFGLNEKRSRRSGEWMGSLMEKSK